MNSWRIRVGEQLCNARGETVAWPGDVVAEDHPAVASCADISRIAVLVPEQVSESAPITADAPIVLDPAKLAAFGRKKVAESAG